MASGRPIHETVVTRTDELPRPGAYQVLVSAMGLGHPAAARTNARITSFAAALTSAENDAMTHQGFVPP
jgi:hypothetical protein